ncbi:TetR/AcrR family transcriptional regulator [Bounagaea algeriensis]
MSRNATGRNSAHKIESTSAPPRNTRPRNRRALITAAAAELFHRRGYAQVSMSDIAEAVGVRSSALYRHFAGKQHLLTEVVLDEMRPLRAGAEHLAVSDVDRVVAELATQALDHRQLGVLWQREARHLPAAQRETLREELRGVARALERVARCRRPELSREDAWFRAWCLFSVLTSPSYHRAELPRGQFEHLLRAMLAVVLDQPPRRFTRPDERAEAQRHAAVPPRASRRRLVLSAATRLFSECGYTQVTIEDVGAAAGMSGPSLYNYFASKQELLNTVIMRGSAWLEVELERTLARHADPADALRALQHTYTDFAFDHGRFIDILVSEVHHLPDEQRHRARQTQHAYVAEWVGLLCEARSGLDAARARVLVQAALTLANDLARTGSARHLAALESTAAALMLDSVLEDPIALW